MTKAQLKAFAKEVGGVTVNTVAFCMRDPADPTKQKPHYVVQYRSMNRETLVNEIKMKAGTSHVPYVFCPEGDDYYTKDFLLVAVAFVKKDHHEKWKATDCKIESP